MASYLAKAGIALFLLGALMLIGIKTGITLFSPIFFSLLAFQSFDGPMPMVLVGFGILFIILGGVLAYAGRHKKSSKEAPFTGQNLQP